MRRKWRAAIIPPGLALRKYSRPGLVSDGSSAQANCHVASCSSTGDEATANLLDTIDGMAFAQGDLAHDNGTAAEFTNCYDPTWGRHKSRTKPAPGNHEYNTAGATGYYGQVHNGDTYGVLKLTLSAGDYAWQFVPVACGTFTDSGTGTCHSEPPPGRV